MARYSFTAADKKKAFNKVASTRGGMKCGRSTRGAKREVCLSVAPIPGFKCGHNPLNKLYSCVATGRKTAKPTKAMLKRTAAAIAKARRGR